MARTTRSRRSRSEPIEHEHFDGPVVPAVQRPPQDGTAGPPPGLRDDTRIHVTSCTGKSAKEWQGLTGLAEAIAEPTTTVWIDMVQPTVDQVTEIAKLLGLHPLIAEDILEGNQRAKIEVTDELVHIVMFALEYRGQMISTEIDFVLGQHFLLTVHAPEWDPRATSHLREGLGSIMARGADHLLWALVDSLVDSYFPFIDHMGDEIDEIEDEVVTKAEPAVLTRLFDLKRDLLTARRAAAPVREIFNQLTNRDLALIDREEVVYFRDVYDHLIRLTDELDNYRELVSGTLDVYLSTINNNLSVVMKRLTGVTVILAGAGAIAGIFGMSEAGAAFNGAEAGGFWLVTAGTVVAVFAAAAFLRKIGWI
jgi:magnesium transporter